MVRLFLRYWPGAERFRQDGGLIPLGQVLVFSLLLNVSFLSVFIWPGMFSIGQRAVVCLSVAIFWLACRPWRVKTVRQGDRAAEIAKFSDQDLFRDAQREYLLGNWTAAEQLLARQISREPRDLASHLLLGALYRRMGNISASEQQIQFTRTLPDAPRWDFEIQQEESRLARVRSELGSEMDAAGAGPGEEFQETRAA